jgi:predicted DNA-binding helix-hairpin-helix protein
MDLIDRLNMLSSHMELEPAEDAGCPVGIRKDHDPYLSQAALPGGKKITLLKTLLTSACERNCNYCPFRAGRDFRRASFSPDELAKTFIALHQAGITQGIFLSSGIIRGGLRTQDQLIDTAAILRDKYLFQGYIHLKIMPGAEHAQVERSMQLADRVSINLEAPNTHRLQKLAPGKQFIDELLEPLRWVNDIRTNQSGRRGWKGHWPSSVTQFVVGAVGESDLELLDTTEMLHRRLGLRRVYYSAFTPHANTPLENQSPESLLRQNRLYQAFFLIRDYGFDLPELPLDSQGNLASKVDPKLSWAQEHLAQHPVEINQVDPHQLLRIPGIGPKRARAILSARKQHRITTLNDLKQLGVNTSRCAPFILINGRRPIYQPALFVLAPA